MTADKVVQKFQAGVNQYIAANPTYLAPAGSPVACAKQNNNQLDAFVVGRDGAVYLSWEANNRSWSDGSSGRPGPARITSPDLAPPGAAVAAVKQNDHQLDAFVVGKDGALYVTWEAND